MKNECRAFKVGAILAREDGCLQPRQIKPFLRKGEIKEVSVGCGDALLIPENKRVEKELEEMLLKLKVRFTREDPPG